MLDVVLLAFALAMDASAAALTRGLGGRRAEGVAVVVLFGGFQAAMAGLGMLLSDVSADFLGKWKVWVASTLLLLLGGRMIWNAWSARNAETADSKTIDSISWWQLFVLAFATSIDAAVAGTTLQAFSVSASMAIVLIGVITAGCSAIGFAVGLWLRQAAGRAPILSERANARSGAQTLMFDLSGGLVLVGLGVKTAFQAG